MLNTNADTIAGETAKALSALFDVTLVYCFEKKGVLRQMCIRDRSGGDASKFGLTSSELLEALDFLESKGMKDCRCV